MLWWQRLKEGLSRTRTQLGSQLRHLLQQQQLDPETLQTLEKQLILADVGVTLSQEIVSELQNTFRKADTKDTADLTQMLQKILSALLMPCERTITWQTKPHVILMIGVNGVGKTTTIGKLAHYWQSQDKKVLLAAGDTFRAAAVEQLQEWGTRTGATVIAQHTGADSASVIFDGFQAALARHYDILLADSAGRLHNKDHLMMELQKIKRVLGKLDPAAPHDIWMVLDATTGQNGLAQAKEFHQHIGLTGIILTKLDGTAKGGIIFAIARELQLPIYFIGVGEGMEDLQPFNANGFVEALLT